MAKGLDPIPDGAPALARALVGTSPLPLLLLDRDLRVVCAARSFCSAFDLPEDQVEGRRLADLGAGEWDIPQLTLLLENALLNGPEMGDFETELVRDGRPDRRLSVNAHNVVGEGTPDARVLLAINDVTDARNAERLIVTLLLEKDELLREREMLMQEMQHRVANSLQIIASVLMMKARTVTSDETKGHLRDAHDRVMLVAAVQQHLLPGAGVIDVGPYLSTLCESLASSMIETSRPLTVEVAAVEAWVSSQEAVSLGLVVTELVINALKYAFPDGRGGRVMVAYEVRPEGWTLEVVDNGVGISHPSAKTRSGLGTSIVRSVAKQLGAHVAISDAAPGVRVQLSSIEGAGGLPAGDLMD